MSEHVTQGMIDCWRANYDLDKTPHDLHAFWGYEAPSGAVIALKAACDEIESLRKDAERYRKLRARVRGERRCGTGKNQEFAFPSRFELPPLGDVMRGSVAQHLDAALDALPGVEDAIL